MDTSSIVMVRPGRDELPGDYIEVRTSARDGAKIAIEIHDVVPGETASVKISPIEARDLIVALMQALEAIRTKNMEDANER